MDGFARIWSLDCGEEYKLDPERVVLNILEIAGVSKRRVMAGTIKVGSFLTYVKEIIFVQLVDFEFSTLYKNIKKQ